MASFEITGGKKLHGEILPQGAKNESLQILCATLLTPDKVTIHNIPDIRDVNKLIVLLGKMGVTVEKMAKKFNPGLFHVSEISCVVHMAHSIKVSKSYSLFDRKPIFSFHLSCPPLVII